MKVKRNRPRHTISVMLQQPVARRQRSAGHKLDVVEQTREWRAIVRQPELLAWLAAHQCIPVCVRVEAHDRLPRCQAHRHVKQARNTRGNKRVDTLRAPIVDRRHVGQVAAVAHVAYPNREHAPLQRRIFASVSGQPASRRLSARPGARVASCDTSVRVPWSTWMRAMTLQTRSMIALPT